MHISLLDLLACPVCATDAPLKSRDPENGSGVLSEGELVCSQCDRRFPVRNGIPRFVEQAEDYCGNFGFQWQKWKEVQIDRLNGHHLSEQRFYRDSRWDRDWMGNKLILDAGCGAGRFTDIAAATGARVIAIDLSNAIDACQQNTRIHGENVQCIQGSLLALPFKKNIFDGIYCMGVIQHTPDPAAVMTGLPPLLRAGGRIVYSFYEEGWWRRLQIIKYLLRLITPYLPISVTLGLSKALVGSLFWLTSLLAPIPKIRVLNHFMPIAAVHDPALTRAQQYVWTLLDTFDWYGARYEKRQHHQHVADLMRSVKLDGVRSDTGLAWGTRPDRK